MGILISISSSPMSSCRKPAARNSTTSSRRARTKPKCCSSRATPTTRWPNMACSMQAFLSWRSPSPRRDWRKKSAKFSTPQTHRWLPRTRSFSPCSARRGEQSVELVRHRDYFGFTETGGVDQIHAIAVGGTVRDVPCKSQMQANFCTGKHYKKIRTFPDRQDFANCATMRPVTYKIVALMSETSADESPDRGKRGSPYDREPAHPQS